MSPPQVTLTSGRTVGRLALGTYHGPPDPVTDAAYEAVLQLGLASGCQLIDVAPHYRGGASLKLVGRIVTSCPTAVVCCKLGFVPGNRNRARATLLAAGLETAGIRADHHSVDPAYLAFEFEQAMAVLGCDCLPILLLHNPEEMLKHTPRGEAFATLRRAFAWLEGLAALGRIEMYGIATSRALCAAPIDQLSIGLEEILALCEQIGGSSHHFRLVQAPLSLARPEAVKSATQMVGGALRSMVDACRLLSITPMLTSPLGGGAVLALADRAESRLDRSAVADAALDWVFSRAPSSIVVLGTTQRAHLMNAIARLGAPP